MKPIYLEFNGLNSFSSTAKIDFTKLLQGGVFGVFGATGSGKSSILDAIHFALYGTVDRASETDCINHNSDKMSVIFEFEILQDGTRKRYRIERERRRKNGTTKAYLYEIIGDKVLAVAEGARDASVAIEKIIGLTFEDFKICIALPQGDFAALVKAKTKERIGLVARLFNLEKYGDKLYQAVSQRQRDTGLEADALLREMGDTAEVSEEILQALKEEIAQDKTAEEQERKTLAKAEEKLRVLEVLRKEKSEYEKLILEIEKLRLHEGEMVEKKRLLNLLPTAKSVTERALELTKLQLAERALLEKKENGERAQAEISARIENKKAEIETADYEEKKTALRLDIQKHESLASEVAQAEKAQADLNACIKEYKELLAKCPAEDFDEKEKALEREIVALGEDNNLFEFVKRHFKGSVLGDTYAEIRSDLTELSHRHPTAKEDIASLLEKYCAPELADEPLDFEKANITFKEVERKKRLLKTELDGVKRRRLDFEANEREKESVKKRGDRLREDYNTAKEKIALLNGLQSKDELQKSLERLQRDEKVKREELERLTESKAQLLSQTETAKALLLENNKSQTATQEKLELAIEESGFESVEKAKEIVVAVGDERLAKMQTEEFFQKLTLYSDKQKGYDEEKLKGYDESEFLSARAEKGNIAERVNELNRSIGAKEQRRKVLEEKLAKRKDLQKVYEQKRKYTDLCEELKKILKGNAFLEFVASEYLQEISSSASDTLSELTGGRYYLRYEGKEFKVADNFDGGNLRTVMTLSGGETFLVSLSLALALSKAICLKSSRPIEFFFLDEGFGTLDSGLVDTVMDTLGKLGKDFSIGLISHVEELKRRIERKILVTAATKTEGSQVRTVVY